MAVTWTLAAAPTAAVQKHVGSARGVQPNSVFVPLQSYGGKRRVLGTLGASGTYTTGGDSFSPALFGLSEIHRVFIVADDATAGQSMIVAGNISFDLSNPKSPKVKVRTTGQSEVAGATTVTLSSVPVIVEGI